MISFLTTFFQKTYELFASVRVPGFNISLISVLFGSFGAIVSISVLKTFFGLGNSSVSGGLGTMHSVRQKGGNNKKLKISEERKKDKK